MKPSELLSYWRTPDNTRLTAKQTSVRFPVHVAAKISALCDMYPRKSRTEIIGDLLTFALDEMERAFPKVPGEPIGPDPEGVLVYLDIGPGSHYRGLTNKHYKQLEAELGNPDAPLLYDADIVCYKENVFDEHL